MALKKISKTSLEKASEQLWNILKNQINYLSKDDKEIVELAFTQMVMAHGEQKRKNGDFYITHPVAVCLILAEMNLGKDTLAASLIHDVPEETKTTLKDLSKDFSPKIIFLVEGVTKFSALKYEGKKEYAENLRRMFVAMSKDIRIIFIKLVERLHNLQTLKYVEKDKRKRVAIESLEIYAPIAERLGMSKFRGMIEDAAFPFVYPEEYQKLIHTPSLEINHRDKISKKITKKVKKIIDTEKIPYKSVIGRAKRYYSIFKKVNDKEKRLENIYDLIALRIITYNVDHCYQILSLLHNYFEPLESRIKDYISNPKSNGYQSIHTTVKDPDTGEIFEFQIRTKEMHHYAEFGIATHWAYKEGVDVRTQESDGFKPERFKWISELVDLGDKKIDEQEYLKKVKLNLYQDRIFVMTPKKDVIDLEKGATALDFAFKIHEEIGKKAVMAKINGETSKLGDILKNGDTVEIITNKNQSPKYDWLERVKTSNAVKKIRRFINQRGKH